MENIYVSKLYISDLKEVKKVFNEVFSSYPWLEKWDKEVLDNYLYERLEFVENLSFGLFEEKKLIGFALGYKKFWHDGNIYMLEDLGILNEYQNRHLGTYFLKEIENVLKEEGISKISLYTNKSYPAYKFYLKNEFESQDEDVIMVKNI